MCLKKIHSKIKRIQLLNSTFYRLKTEMFVLLIKIKTVILHYLNRVGVV